MGTFPCEPPVNATPTAVISPPGLIVAEGDTWSFGGLCLGGDAPVTNVFERSDDNGATWFPSPSSGTISAADAALGQFLVRRVCTDVDGDESTATGLVTIASNDCMPVTIATNPLDGCGTSADWETSLSAAGPWVAATNYDETCSALGNPSPITGAGFIGADPNPGASAAPRFFRTVFSISASQAAGLQSAMLTLIGDSAITSVTLNGTSIYSGSPPNSFNTIAGPFQIASLPALNQAGNTLIVEHDQDTFVFDGVIVKLDLSCDPAPFDVTATPADQTVAPGDTATITGAATGGTPPYSNHRWEVTDDPLTAGTIIPGETGTTLDVEGQ